MTNDSLFYLTNKMKEITQEKINNFCNFMDNHDHFFVIGHKEPDGDCIASCLGVASILKNKNKSCTLLNAGPFKRVEIQKFADLFTSEIPFLSDEDIKKTGLIICDCSELHRLGDLNIDFKDFDTFIIDHHKTAEIFDNPNAIIDSTAPAASLLVQILHEALVQNMEKETAEILYFGTMTDTGFFRFLSSNDSDVLINISRLLACGADPRKTYDYITSGKSYSTRKLLGILLNHAEQYLDGKLVISYETMEDTHRFGQEGRDSDLLYSSLLAVKGVEAVVFVRQETENTCTAGLRSRDAIDVSQIAAKFGGGGHKNASGLSCTGKLETLIPAIVQEFKKIM